MNKPIEQVNLFCDGGCRGNPGPGAIGLLILDTQNQELHRHAEPIGHTTNNRAEYCALIKGLDSCAKFTRHRVVCFMDSKLIVNQMNGTWRLKNDELRSLYHKVKDRERVFKEVTYQYVQRTNPTMKKVDRLLNQAFEGR
ncbi:MAG TPA: ribonuclease HI family protein [Dehalococcoidia bacterium]|nr:ribonuclease HI family protein [Dehalococcoidia bacterium]